MAGLTRDFSKQKDRLIGERPCNKMLGERTATNTRKYAERGEGGRKISRNYNLWGRKDSDDLKMKAGDWGESWFRKCFRSRTLLSFTSSEQWRFESLIQKTQNLILIDWSMKIRPVVMFSAICFRKCTKEGSMWLYNALVAIALVSTVN